VTPKSKSCKPIIDGVVKVVVETDVGIVLVTVGVETVERKKLNLNYNTV